MSLDPWFANQMNPQSWNRYVYGYNNPALLIDPYGYLGLPSIPNPIDAVGKCLGDMAECVKNAGEKVGEGAQKVEDGAIAGGKAVGGGVVRAADWTRDQAVRAGSWLSTCNWGKVAAGAVVIAGGAFVAGTGGFALGVAGVGAEATTALGLYEGLETTTLLGMTTTAGGGIMGLGSYALTQSQCGQGAGDMKE